MFGTDREWVEWILTDVVRNWIFFDTFFFYTCRIFYEDSLDIFIYKWSDSKLQEYKSIRFAGILIMTDPRYISFF